LLLFSVVSTGDGPSRPLRWSSAAVAIDRDKTLQAAQKYIERKRYDRAIAEYQRIVQEDPSDARTLLKIGDLQARLQAFPEAIATYDRVGQHYASQQLHLKAIAVYKQIREIIRKHAPDLADRYAYIGPRLAEIYTELGLISDALQAWDEVATRFLRAGRDREGIDVFAKMVDLDAKNPLPHLRLAEACCRVHSLDEAVQSFGRAAELLLELGRSDDALKVFDRILHFRAEPAVARAAAEIYLGRGSRDDGLLALAKLQICFQADPRDLETLGLLARAFTTIGQAEKAVEVYKEMARIARDQGRIDLMPGLIAKLRAASPDDEHVRALESLLPPLSPPESLLPDSLLPEPEVVDVELHEEPSPSSRAHRSRSGTLLGRESSETESPSSPDVEIETSFSAESPSTVLQAFDARAHARKAVADADSFRRLRLFSKAVGTLNVALEVDPLSIEIRSKLREILNEAGDREGAIGESVNIAALWLDLGENERSAELLREVLRQDPSHEGALALLEQIQPSRAPASRSANSHPAPTAASLSSEAPRELFGADAPLPSYDLEEVSAGQAMSGSPSLSPDSLRSGPLPSFPLGEMSEPEPLAPFGSSDGSEELEEISEVEELGEQRAPQPGTLDEVLEEAEFYAARGLLSDAHAILSEQLSRTPGHRLILERLREIEIQRHETESNPRIDRLELAVSTQIGFDGSTPLGTLNSIEPARGSTSRRSPAPPSVDVEQLFAKVKAGIRADVSDSDAATHYDLALAYKEMGLVSDALKEFELAAREPARECMCYAMIGVIHFDQGQYDRAASAQLRALEATSKSSEQELGLYYDLAITHEKQGKLPEAMERYRQILDRDPNYRDVSDRAQALTDGQKRPVREASGTRVVSDDDDFERVFDDLFESK
jgi:tetratricopeptide (TPR) repeat protein